MDWEKFRRLNRSINLIDAWRAGNQGKIRSKAGYEFLQLVEEYQPIVSRQAAAIALAQADVISFRIILE
ncbi:MAG: hypothetical protein M1497_01950 [Nitrospirae bacterium]|nr:hypothetical protein [Nitrospirota bacterium]